MNPLKDRPEGGWQQGGWYWVDAALYRGDPYRRLILYVGLLNPDGSPGRNSCYLGPAFGKIPLGSRPYARISRIELAHRAPHDAAWCADEEARLEREEDDF